MIIFHKTTIQPHENDYLLKPNNTYFTDKAYTKPNDILVVNNIPAKNQSKSNNKSPSKANRVLPDNHDEFSAN